YRDGLAQRRGESDGAACRDFFRNEYRLDRLTARYPKPYISLIDGVFMGGGVGISCHGTHRVVTEKALFAMPETGIGLFPDVGASYLLPRLPGKLGAHLGLTGARLKAADLLYAGIATAYVPSAKLEQLLAALAETPENPADVIAAFAETPAEAPELATLRDRIDHCFAAPDVVGVLERLDGDASEWAAATAAGLRRMSPTSLKLTFEASRRGAALSLEDCFVMEYRLSQGCMAGGDFYEGVRAVLIDKDKSPRWSPGRLEEVTEAMISAHFAVPSLGDLCFDNEGSLNLASHV
ncbi:MAG TPA: enoyl-CoA hydratase/isomerase family protein, partial [Azospirillaceae bacterium]|nr:enoyl-CoA hydratase/isomerase family protein [Azospirillaceae bacterium]